MVLKKLISRWESAPWGGMIFPLILLLSVLYYWHSNPLLSDDEMIAHFRAHQAEITALVESYYEFKKTEEVRVWDYVPENVEKMKRAGVKRVIHTGGMWHPNPYSIEASKAHLETMQRERWARSRFYKSVSVELVDDSRPNNEFGRVLLSSGYRLIFKDLVYYPEVPKVENGKIWWPIGADGYMSGARAFSSLDSYPPDWKRGECVYRKIESQWFIRMCIAAV